MPIGRNPAMPHPNSLANLKPPWQSGEQPKPGERYIQRMVNRAQKAGPQAMRLMTQCMRDPELPISQRLRCAEFIIEHTWPKEAAAGLLGALGNGAEWLELRFVSPSGQASKDNPSLQPQAISTTYSVEEEISHTSSPTDAEDAPIGEDGEDGG